MISIFLITKPLQISRACSFEPEDYIAYYSLFDPSLSNMEDFNALHVSFDRYYSYDWFNNVEAKQKDNLKEWQQYAGAQASAADIALVVYTLSREDMNQAQNWLQKKGKGKLPESLSASNTFLQALNKSRNTDAADYLLYAKRCEPQVTVDPESWDPPAWDLTEMARLVTEGKNKYAQTQDPFLKMRYAFQVVRLAHYSGQLETCVKLFDELVLPLKNTGLLYWWSLGHKAGALQDLNRHLEAAYLFSQVFENCPSKRIQAWQSLSVESDEEWDSVLTYCKTPAEKATLYFMRGINIDSRALDEMKAIYALDPASDKIAFLMSREINKLESDFFGWDFDFAFPLKQSYKERSTAESLAYLNELYAFADLCVKENKIRKGPFFRMAQGYLAFMRSDFDKADALFAAVATQSSDARDKTYAGFYRWVIRLSRLTKLTPADELRLYQEMKKLPFAEDEPHQLRLKSSQYLFKTYARLYKVAGAKGKAYLCTQTYYDLLMYPDKAVVYDILKWLDGLQTRKPNELELELISRIDASQARNLMLEMKATLLMREGRWKEAIAIYEKLPQEALAMVTTYNIPLDPFQGFPSDCVNCWEVGTGDSPYNRLTFARKMVELDAEALRKPSAEVFMKLGNACYNMTYFGPAWMATAYYRSGGSIWVFDAESNDEWAVKEKNSLFVDMTRAEAYYRKAIALTTKNPELGAEATFMAAKCRQNQFYLDGYSDWEEEDLKRKPLYRKDFDALIAKYKKTRYYERAIGECGFLDTYSYGK
ncbi:MAG: hypothetical protein EAZ89_05585 [Bacteroidetes bacterium]|nr:MAG: hypothetical protein EAZ89_05585 [Bacteroidota bacterium]